MFFHIVLERNMQLHTRHFGPRLRDKLVGLMKDDEGTCRHGFVVAITVVDEIGKELIRDGTGFVTFPMKYQCVVFGPGEILGSLSLWLIRWISLRRQDLCRYLFLTISFQMIWTFILETLQAYTTADGSVRIQKDSEVRLKILGTRVDAKEIFCIGTIKDDYLGVISDPGAVD